MLREVLHSKLHRAIVTKAVPDYVGSITIDADFLKKSGMRVNDKVLISNCRNGERFETYIFKGKKGSKCIEINGAAAHLVEPGDPVIVMHYAFMTNKEYKKHKPVVLIMDEKNNVAEVIRYGNK